MAYYRTSRIVPVVFTIIIIAAAIAALFSVARMLFFPSMGSDPGQLGASQTALLDNSADRAVEMSVRGPIVADEKFRSYQIKVSPNKRVLNIFKGYSQQVIGSTPHNNSVSSYSEFVYALNMAELTKDADNTKQDYELRGLCATGYLYEFKLLKADKVEKTLWTTTCKSTPGTLVTKRTPLTKLFIAQIPDAQKTIDALWR